MELCGYLMKYKWGKPRATSAVAEVLHPEMKAEIDKMGPESPEDDHYAELWYGTHPNGPTRVRPLQSSQEKQDWKALADVLNPENEVPFLLKVLSIANSLSIQAHPNTEAARRLHKKFPEIYKDPNHKPEISIALSEKFELLFGFKKMVEIKAEFEDLPFLTKYFPCVEGPNATKTLFESIFLMSGHFECINELLSYPRDRVSEKTREIILLVERLHKQFPNDIGVLCPLLLNYVTLSRGHAIFISSGVPHAYISGDCIECMACSDNVVRAGLTPKYIDVETLFEIANYDDNMMEKGRVVPHFVAGIPGTLRIFEVPAPEFAVCQWELPPGTGETAFPADKIGCTGRIKVAVFLSGVGSTIKVVKKGKTVGAKDLVVSYKGFAMYFSEDESFTVATGTTKDVMEVFVVFPAKDHVKQPKLTD